MAVDLRLSCLVPLLVALVSQVLISSFMSSGLIECNSGCNQPLFRIFFGTSALILVVLPSSKIVDGTVPS